MSAAKRRRDSRPNIIWIMCDDLAWGDLGCYGQTKIRTPNVDALAAGGIRFTQCYSGSTVCAPSRSCLMQGLHQGHATVRANMLGGYRHCLQPEDVTVAEVLHSAGYATGLFGKWGLSNYDQPGVPTRKGFDEFYGYLNQRHAHNYYPTHLWHNEQRVGFPQHKGFVHTRTSDYDAEGNVLLKMADPSAARYSFDVYAEASLDFVRRRADGPFFLYLAYTPPHGVLVVPSLGPYAKLDWPDIRHKEWAAMITRMDGEVGRLVALLSELDIHDNTLMFFCSDNGYSPMGTIPKRLTDAGVPSLEEFFGHRGPWRGGKGDLREGGLRVPMIAHWPAVVRQARTSDLPWAFWDFLPTAARLARAEMPARCDGQSIAAALLGREADQPRRERFYWEFFGAEGLEQAARIGGFWAYRPHAAAPVEVYDVAADPGETDDLAGRRGDVAAKAAELFVREHEPTPYNPTIGETLKDWSARVKAEVGDLPQNIDTF